MGKGVQSGVHTVGKGVQSVSKGLQSMLGKMNVQEKMQSMLGRKQQQQNARADRKDPRTGHVYKPCDQSAPPLDLTTTSSATPSSGGEPVYSDIADIWCLLLLLCCCYVVSYQGNNTDILPFVGIRSHDSNNAVGLFLNGQS